MAHKELMFGVDYADDVEGAYQRGELGDTPLIEQIMDHAAAAGMTSVCWRVSHIGKLAYRTRVGTVLDGMNALRISLTPFGLIMKRIDPLRVAIDEAHKRGLKLFVYLYPVRTKPTRTRPPASSRSASSANVIPNTTWCTAAAARLSAGCSPSDIPTCANILPHSSGKPWTMTQTASTSTAPERMPGQTRSRCTAGGPSGRTPTWRMDTMNRTWPGTVSSTGRIHPVLRIRTQILWSPPKRSSTGTACGLRRLPSFCARSNPWFGRPVSRYTSASSHPRTTVSIRDTTAARCWAVPY